MKFLPALLYVFLLLNLVACDFGDQNAKAIFQKQATTTPHLDEAPAPSPDPGNPPPDFSPRFPVGDNMVCAKILDVLWCVCGDMVSKRDTFADWEWKAVADHVLEALKFGDHVLIRKDDGKSYAFYWGKILACHQINILPMPEASICSDVNPIEELNSYDNENITY